MRVLYTSGLHRYNINERGVAQLGRVPGWGPGGHQFKSGHPDVRNGRFLKEAPILCASPRRERVSALLRFPAYSLSGRSSGLPRRFLMCCFASARRTMALHRAPQSTPPVRCSCARSYASAIRAYLCNALPEGRVLP